MPKRVAIILLNWNGLEDTLECVASLSILKYRDYQIIVVDNHSDEDLAILRVLHPDVILIRNQENYGFAKGNNIGINKAAELGFEYCWILNNDTTVAPDALNKLVSVLEGDETVAAVTNQICYYNDPSLTWFNGGIFKNGLPASRSFFQKVTEQNTSSTTEFLAGTSFLARTAVLEEVGGFDESYFCYVEDVDLSLRIRRLGYHIAYVPEVLVWHKVSRSTGMLSPIKLYYKHRNMLYFLKKFNYSRYPVVIWWVSSARFVVSLLLKHREPKAAWYLVKGLLDAVRLRMGRCNSL